MPFSVNEIRSQLTRGGARPNLFQVQIDTKNSAANVKLPFLCEAAQLPSSTLGVIQVPYFGRMHKLAGDRVFGPWTVTIINDEDFKIREAMEAWSNKINKHVGNIRTLRDYKSDAIVTQFGKEGDTLRQYKMVGLFPTIVGEIDLNWGNVDTIETYQVEFQFDYWEISGGTTGNAGGQ